MENTLNKDSSFKIEPNKISINIKIDDKIIGKIYSLYIKEKNGDDPIINITRSLLFKSKLDGVFARDFVHRNSQILPFQIEILDTTGPTTIIQNAWIDTIFMTYTVEEFVILEGADLIAEKIISKNNLPLDK